jgi:hypothetical protein
MTAKQAKELGVCCARWRGQTCGRKLKKGKCSKHGEHIHDSIGKDEFYAAKANRDASK